MHVRKDDKVIVISGKDKGKTGKILKVFPRDLKVLVEGVHILKKHERARSSGAKGQIVERATPIHISNVLLIDPDSGKSTRTGKKKVAEGFVRIARRSGKEL